MSSFESFPRLVYDARDLKPKLSKNQK